MGELCKQQKRAFSKAFFFNLNIIFPNFFFFHISQVHLKKYRSYASEGDHRNDSVFKNDYSKWPQNGKTNLQKDFEGG